MASYLVVRGAKDLADRRRVMYELEDVLRSLVRAQELGLDKVTWVELNS